MKWIGQEIYDLVSRFRSDVHLDGVSTSTETDMLVVDSNNKISKRAFSTFMTNGADNRILTATGANGINAEQYLFFDGTFGSSFLYLQPIANTDTSCFYIDAHALTTGSGILLDIEDSLTTAASKSLINIDYDKSGVTGSGIINAVTGLNVSLVDAATNHASSSTIATGVNVAIDAASDQGDIRQVGYSATLTDGDVANTTGYYSNVEDGGIDFKSVSSADTGDMFTIATTTHGATTLTTTDDDATAAHFEIAADGNITLDAAGAIALESSTDTTINTRVLSLENVGSSHGTHLTIKDTNNSADEKMSITFTKDKGAAGANGDSIFGIHAIADNDAQELTNFASITTAVIDAADTDEAGALLISVATSNGTTSALQNGLLARGHGTNNDVDVTLGYGSTSETTVAGNLTVTSDLTVSGTTTTVNTTNLNIEDKNITLNYNATSDTSSTAEGAGITIQDAVDASNDALFSWDAGDNKWKTSHSLSVLNASSGGVPALIVNNEDVDQIALDINTENTTANIIDIDAKDLTTGNAIFIDANSLTSGSAITIDVDDATTTTAVKSLMRVDYDKSGVTASSQANHTTGLYVTMDDAATNDASALITHIGTRVAMTAASNQGSITQIGSSISLTGGDPHLSFGIQSVVQDGGVDFKAFSSQDTGDYFSIATSTHGATTLTTVDDDAAAAHFEIEADGNIKLNAAGDILLDAHGNVGIGTNSPESMLHLESTGDTAIIVRADANNSGENDNPLIHLQQDYTVQGAGGSLVDSKFGIVGDAGQIYQNSLSDAAYITAQGSGAATALQFATGGLNPQDISTPSEVATARMTIAGDGNIGIGVNDPDSMLEIYGTSQPQLKLSNNANDFAAFAVGTHGQLTISTTDAAATNAHFEVEADGNITLDPAGTIALEANTTVTGDLTVNGDTVTFESSNADDPMVTIKNTSNAANDMASLNFVKDRDGGTAAIGDNLGEIYFSGEDASGNTQEYSRILSEIDVATHGQESGILKFGVANHDGGNGYGLILQGGSANDEVDVTVGLGTGSLTTITGTLTMGSTATLDNSGNLLTNAATATALTSGDKTIEGNLRIGGSGDTSNNWITIDAQGGTDTTGGGICFYETGTDTIGSPQFGAKIVYNEDDDEFAIGTMHSGTFMRQIHMDRGSNQIIVKFLTAKSDSTDGPHLTVHNSDTSIVDGQTIGRLLCRDDDRGAITSRINWIATEDHDSDSGGTKIDFIITPNGNSQSETTAMTIGQDSSLTVNGNIELGHASDTTIARSAAGKVTIEGNQVVTAGAVNVSSGSQSPIGMQVARRTITTGEANTMFTGGLSYASIELIPAQGANTIIMPASCMAKVDRAANQLNGSTTMDVHYDGQTGGYGASSLFHWRRFGFGETTDYVERRSINQVTSGLTLTEDVNKAVEISFNGGAPTTDCFTSIDIFITYYVLDIS